MRLRPGRSCLYDLFRSELFLGRGGGDGSRLACDAPGITSGPGLTHVSGSQFNLSWNNSSGCAPVTSTYNFCFNVAYGGGGKVEPFCEDFQVTSGQTSGNETITLSWEFSGSWRSLELVSLEISPRDRAYPSWATSYPTVEFANIWAFRTRPGSD